MQDLFLKVKSLVLLIINFTLCKIQKVEIVEDFNSSCQVIRHSGFEANQYLTEHRKIA